MTKNEERFERNLENLGTLNRKIFPVHQLTILLLPRIQGFSKPEN